MKKREPVSHIMTKHVVSIQQNESLEKANALVSENEFRHLPVTWGGKVVGIISSTDLNRLSFSNLFEHQENADTAVMQMLAIEDVMTHTPSTIESSTSIKEVAEIFAKEHYHALPVVESDELVGIVTTTDIIQYLLDQY